MREKIERRVVSEIRGAELFYNFLIRERQKRIRIRCMTREERETISGISSSSRVVEVVKY